MSDLLSKQEGECQHGEFDLNAVIVTNEMSSSVLRLVLFRSSLKEECYSAIVENSYNARNVCIYCLV